MPIASSVGLIDQLPLGDVSVPYAILADMARPDRPLDDDDPRHGTSNGYGNCGCRCDACRAAHAATHAAYIKRQREEGRVVGRHGSSVAYDTGCRCDVCRLAHNARSVEKKRRARERTRPAG